MAGWLKRFRALLGCIAGRTVPQPAEALPGGGRTVLLIGLGQRPCGTLARRLEALGFRARVASGEEAGREALEREGPALVLVCGPASLDFYRLLRRMTSAPILALDAQAPEDKVLAALAGGVDQFQARPVSEGEAVARILALLRRAA
ncbi:MAG: hypothetical protein ACP5OO_01695 [Chloroflexia bacterium]